MKWDRPALVSLHQYSVREQPLAKLVSSLGSLLDLITKAPGSPGKWACRPEPPPQPRESDSPKNVWIDGPGGVSQIAKWMDGVAEGLKSTFLEVEKMVKENPSAESEWRPIADKLLEQRALTICFDKEVLRGAAARAKAELNQDQRRYVSNVLGYLDEIPSRGSAFV